MLYMKWFFCVCVCVCIIWIYGSESAIHTIDTFAYKNIADKKSITLRTKKPDNRPFFFSILNLELTEIHSTWNGTIILG